MNEIVIRLFGPFVKLLCSPAFCSDMLAVAMFFWREADDILGFSGKNNYSVSIIFLNFANDFTRINYFFSVREF